MDQRSIKNVTPTLTKSDRPTKLEFVIGGFDLVGRYCLRLDGDQVQYGIVYGYEMFEVKASAIPSKRKWINFIKKLDAINAWKWKKHYDNPSVLDGIQWELEIVYGKQKIKSFGSNWYPGSTNYDDLNETAEFKALKHALSLLLGGVRIV